MNIDEIIKRGLESDISRCDIFFAWHPVQVGALGTGGWIWLRKVWRNKCCGVTIYQELDEHNRRMVERQDERWRKYMTDKDNK